MKTFTITESIVGYSSYTIEAENEEDAMQQYESDECLKCNMDISDSRFVNIQEN